MNTRLFIELPRPPCQEGITKGAKVLLLEDSPLNAGESYVANSSLLLAKAVMALNQFTAVMTRKDHPVRRNKACMHLNESDNSWLMEDRSR